MPKRIIIFVGLLPALLVSLAADGEATSESYSYPYAFLNRVEGGVSLQRASESEPEPSVINLPVLPGDRIWTAAASRAEVCFTNGTRIRLDEGTKLDFVELDSGILLRGWSGSLILEIDDLADTVRLDTPGGSVIPSTAGSYRIDIEAGETILSVSRGAAELASNRGSVRVESGESSAVAVGEPPGAVVGYNTASFDAFDAWSDALDRSASSRRDVVIRSLPHEVDRYSPTLERYGSWTEDATYGTVWYPQVVAGWAPYRSGSWCHTRYGYTWVSSEPWGWAPYHYGRWGFGRRGWYWIPGGTWGPAWVSFAVGPFWVGWSPLGYHDRPVFVFDSRGSGHYGRASLGSRGGGWNFTTRDDFRRGRGAHRLDRSLVDSTASTARFFEPGTRLDRELNPRSGFDSRDDRFSKRSASRATAPTSRRGFAPPTSTTSKRERVRTSPPAFERRRFPQAPQAPQDEESSGRGRASTSRSRSAYSSTSTSTSPSPRRERPSAFDRARSGRPFPPPGAPSTSSESGRNDRSTRSSSRAFQDASRRPDTSVSRGGRAERTVPNAGYTRGSARDSSASVSRSNRASSRAASTTSRTASPRGSGASARGSSARSSSPSKRKN